MREFSIYCADLELSGEESFLAKDLPAALAKAEKVVTDLAKDADLLGRVDYTVYPSEEDPCDGEGLEIHLNPPEPTCREEEHEWVAPLKLVGGCSQNPGVYGEGPGIVAKDVCRHCGCLRIYRSHYRGSYQGPVLSDEGDLSYREDHYDPEDVERALLG